MVSFESKLLEAGFNLYDLEETVVKTFQASVGGIAKAAQAEWVRIAQEKLKTSRADYINGLRQAESFSVRTEGDSKIYEVQLVGRMPNNYEFGMAAFDMKGIRPGWLGGGKAKIGKDGKRYVTIPFRHSMSSNARLGYTGKAKEANLGKHLKETVKAFGLDKMVRYSDTSGKGLAKVKEGRVASVPNNASGVHPYLQGLTRIQRKSGGSPISPRKEGGQAKERGQSQLMTWRVMSENSDPSSWQHPGTKPAGLLPLVESWLNQEVNRQIESILGD